MRTVRVESPRFSATFKSDGIIREAEPPLTFMIGWNDGKARAVIKKNKWRAVIVAGAGVDDARKLDEIEQPRKAPDYQPLVFLCVVCGAYACFGYGVALRAGRVGTWYCRSHRPEAKSYEKSTQAPLEQEQERPVDNRSDTPTQGNLFDASAGSASADDNDNTGRARVRSDNASRLTPAG